MGVLYLDQPVPQIVLQLEFDIAVFAPVQRLAEAVLQQQHPNRDIVAFSHFTQIAILFHATSLPSHFEPAPGRRTPEAMPPRWLPWRSPTAPDPYHHSAPPVTVPQSASARRSIKTDLGRKPMQSVPRHEIAGQNPRLRSVISGMEFDFASEN
jgi:hypothetical protein